MREITYANAISEGLIQEMRRDPSVFVFGLDVDDHKAIQGSTAGILAEFGSSRIFGTPLSEDAMTGVAVGAAMGGFRPVHVHIRMDFTLLAINQLANMAAKMHYMTNGQFQVPLVIRAMIGRSWGQGAQHSQALQSLFMHIPGLKVVMPSNAHDAKGLITSAIRENSPVIFIEHRLLYSTKAMVQEQQFVVEIGKARVVEKGENITIVAISYMIIEALRAHNFLTSIGISAEVIDPISLKPLDLETIFSSAKKTKNLLIVDNGWLTCGAGAEIITQILERAQSENVSIKFARMGFAESTCPTTRSLEDLFYPNPLTIAKKVCELLGKDISKIDFTGCFNIALEADQFKGPF